MGWWLIMYKIEHIMEKIDWNAPINDNNEGIKMAKSIKDLWYFIQPCNQKQNKNVWDVCAIILSDRDDEELKPYFIPLLIWLQDANWPGFDTIFQRLLKTDIADLKPAISYCIMRAIEHDDKMWMFYLYQFLKEKNALSIVSVDYQDKLISTAKDLEIDDL